MSESTSVCVCGTGYSAPSDEALVDVLEAHLREVDHPGFEASRMYLQNLVEAPRRLDGPIERLDSVGRVEVRDLSVERLDDWLEFFDHRGFAGFPYWASCYCIGPFCEAFTDAENRHWQQNRTEMVGRIERGDVWGVMAYVDGLMAGW